MTGDFVSFQLTPARDRHAATDGRGPRLARRAPGVRGHPRPVAGPGGLGRLRTPRVGRVPPRARPTRTSPPAVSPPSWPRPTPPTARPRPVARGPGQADHRRVRPPDRVRRRALRRHHPHLPQQLVPRRPARQPLPYVSAVAVEEKSVIDYNPGNPDGVLQEGEEPREPNGAARGDLPGGGHALLRQPALRPRRRVGVRRRGRGRRAVHRLPPAAARTRSRSLRFGFRPGNPAVADRQPDRRAPTASTRTSRRPCSRSPSPRCSPSCSTTGRTSASRPACCCSSTSPARWRDLADPETGATKLDLAKQATITALDEFNDDDEVGLLGVLHRPRRPG